MEDEEENEEKDEEEDEEKDEEEDEEKEEEDEEEDEPVSELASVWSVHSGGHQTDCLLPLSTQQSVVVTSSIHSNYFRLHDLV